MKIKSLKARQIIDSRANPTVEVDIMFDNDSFGRAAVPSGASTGKHEALELRDGDKSKYLGKSVQNAVSNVNVKIFDALKNKDFKTQDEIDRFLIELDGTENKSDLGANSILGVSLAFAHASAQSQKVPLFKYINQICGEPQMKLPRPMFNIMNGGKHANWSTDIQEYMVFPMKENLFSERLRIGAEIYLILENLLKDKSLSTNVGNEGGFAPILNSNEEALDLIVESVEKAGYKLGEDIMLGFDAAASEFYNEESLKYELKKDKSVFDSKQMVDWVVSLTQKFPIISFEDMLAQDDWNAWTDLTQRVGEKIQIVGDDLLVTNVKRIERAIEEKSCNALLVKVNQIGTLTETLDAIKLSKENGWENVISHRSAETEDVTIAHIAVGTGVGQIKTGAPSRGERTAKYNELIRIEEILNNY